MNSPTSSRSNNLSDANNRTDLALPLAAVISLAITSYVVVVLVGIVLQKWLARICCSTSESTTNCFCDICSNCFNSTDLNSACCGNSGINCCSPPMNNCCNADTITSCILFKSCRDTSQPIDCQPCDCCCFEIAFHLKGRQSTGSGSVP